MHLACSLIREQNIKTPPKLRCFACISEGICLFERCSYMEWKDAFPPQAELEDTTIQCVKKRPQNAVS